MKELPKEDILTVDVDKYVSWLFSNEGVSDSNKEKSYRDLVEFLCEKDERVDRKEAKAEAYEEIYQKTLYWTPPTKEIKENFAIWRKRAFEVEARFLKTYEGGALSKTHIFQRELDRICDRINTNYPTQSDAMLLGWVTDQYYEMAQLAGMIDYIKSLKPSQNQSLVVSDPTNIKRQEFAFEDCLTLEAKNLFPAIQVQYRNCGAKDLIIMYFALKSLHLIEEEKEVFRGDLWKILKDAFSNNDKRQAFEKQYKEYDNPSHDQLKEIRQQAQVIDKLKNNSYQQLQLRQL